MRRRGAPETDITPLLDVMFILIIFFVITTSFTRTRGEISVELPGGHGAPVKGELSIINVAKDGGLWLDGRAVTSADIVEMARAERSGDKRLVIAGDRNAPYGAVAELLELMRSSGIENATLALDGTGRGE